MMSPILTARVADVDSIENLSQAISLWEPRLDVVAAQSNSMIYEPDGILYAAAVSPPTTLLARHKSRLFRPGDVAVIPRAVAIDAEEPGASYVAIRHDGAAPYHFRERFIQTWGYEHRTAKTFESVRSFDDVIPQDDPRFRVPFHRIALFDSSFAFTTDHDLHLWIGLEGRCILTLRALPLRCEFGPGELVLLAPGQSYSVEGRGIAGRFLLSVESTFEANLLASLSNDRISPEYGADARGQGE